MKRLVGSDKMMSSGARNLLLALVCVAAGTSIAKTLGDGSFAKVEASWQKRVVAIAQRTAPNWPPPAKSLPDAQERSVGLSPLGIQGVSVEPGVVGPLPEGRLIERRYGYSATRRARVSRIDDLNSGQFVVKLDDVAIQRINKDYGPILPGSFGALEELEKYETAFDVTELDFDRYVRLPGVDDIARQQQDRADVAVIDVAEQAVERAGTGTWLLHQLGLGPARPAVVELHVRQPQELSSASTTQESAGILHWLESNFAGEAEAPKMKHIKLTTTVYRITDGSLAGLFLVARQGKVHGDDPVGELAYYFITNQRVELWERLWPLPGGTKS